MFEFKVKFTCFLHMEQIKCFFFNCHFPNFYASIPIPYMMFEPSLLLYLLATSSLMPLQTLDINIYVISGFQLINGCDIQLATRHKKNYF